jgi:hypothetical protein
MADLGDMIARLLLDSKQWLTGMKEVEGSTAASAAAIEGSLGMVGESVKELGKGLAELGLAEGIKHFAEACIEASDDMGRLKTAMVNLKGDTQNVEEFLEHIHELSATSPFAFPELAESAKRMVMLGQSLDQTQETLSAIVETGTALKLTGAQVTGIADAMSKLGQGAEPMRVMKQLVNEGIPAWQMLAQEMGTNIPDAQAKVKSGVISSQQLFESLTKAMDENKDKAAGWADTWRGAMKGLDTATEAAMRNVGDDIKKALNEVAAPALKEVAQLVEKLGEWWKGLPTPVKDAAIAFGAAATAIAAIGGAIAIIGIALEALGTSFLAPVAAIAVLVAALVGVGVWIGEHWGAISDILTHAWDEIEKIWGVTWGEIKAALGIIWDSITAAGKAVFDTYVAVYSVIWDTIKGAWDVIWKAIKLVLTVAWGEIKAGLSIFDAIATYLLAFWEPIKAKFQEVWGFISSNLTSVWGKLAATFGVVQKAAADVTTELTKHVEVHEKLKPKVDDTANATGGLGTQASTLTDKFIALRDKTAILWAEAAILNSKQQALIQTVAKNREEAALMAAAHQTLYDKFMAVIPPIQDTTKAFDALQLAGVKVVTQFGAIGGSVAVAEAALKQLNITSTAAAQKTAEHTTELVNQVTAAGTMMSAYDQLMTKQADLKAQIELLIRTDGDHSAKLAQLQQDLKDTTTQIGAMATSTTDAYHQMGLNTADDIDKIIAKDRERWQTAISLSNDENNGNPALVRQAHAAELQMLKDYDQMGIDMSASQKQRMEDLEKELGKHHDTQREAWKAFEKDVKKDFDDTFTAMEDLLITGDGSFKDIMTKLWQGLAKDALDLFLAPLKKSIEDFMATTIKNLLSGDGLGGISTALSNIGSKIGGLFGGGAPGGLATSGSTMGTVGQAIPGVSGAGGSAAGAATKAIGSSVTGIVGAVGGVVSAVSGVISNFQQAKMETTLNAIEHNTRYTMMYVGERADGGILGVLFKIDEEIAWGANTKATENLRDLFKDWSNPALAAMQGIQQAVEGTAPYIADTKGVMENVRDLTGELVDVTRKGLESLNVNVTATGVTTVEAARKLGDQIAANLARQLVQTS